MAQGGNRFSALLLEGLDHYRKGRMMEAVRAWEEAYLLEPSNLRAREFLRSALERIHAHMTPNTLGREAQKIPVDGARPHPWLPPDSQPPAMPVPDPAVDPAAATQLYQTRPPLPAPGPNTVPPPPEPAVPSLPPAPGPWDEGPSVAIPQKEESN